MIIQGDVAPGFESVKALYERNMHTLAERNTQLCVYVGEERVVDLWASAIDDTQFSADSLVNVFSSGKSLESILLATLVDQGLLSYAAKISEYWPEFSGAGKERLSVADLMRHEAGLAAFSVSLDATDLHPYRLKENAIGSIIESEPVKFRPSGQSTREYHAITRGWVANELFRRVEPQGRTMGEYLRSEICAPLEADVFIGVNDEELARISEVVPLGIGYQFRQSFIPKAWGRKIELNWAQTIAKLAGVLGGMRSRTTSDAPPPLEGMRGIADFNSIAMSKGETPSAGAKASARGLAKLAAVLASGGRFAGREYLSAQAHQQLHAEPVQRNMMSLTTTFTQGGLAEFPAPGPEDTALFRALHSGREGYYGWMGLGGSIFQWHPEHKIGFGYVPSSLHVLDFVNERGKAYQAEVVRCVQAQT